MFGNPALSGVFPIIKSRLLNSPQLKFEAKRSKGLCRVYAPTSKKNRDYNFINIYIYRDIQNRCISFVIVTAELRENTPSVKSVLLAGMKFRYFLRNVKFTIGRVHSDNLIYILGSLGHFCLLIIQKIWFF